MADDLKRRFCRRFLGIFLALVFLSQGANAADAGRASGLSDAPAVVSFYEQRGNKPVWSGSGGNRRKATAVLDVLKDSWTHGLNPDRYRIGDIEEILNRSDKVKKEDRDRFDLLMTTAVIRYGRDMTGMRVSPASIGQKASFWRTPLTTEEILEKIVSSPDPAEAMESLAPRDELYRALRKELISLGQREVEEDSSDVDFGRGLFKPGQTHPQVPELRKKLSVRHETQDGSENFYDDRLAAAVMAFQKRHALKPDGVIGPKTLALINRTAKDRIEQVVTNMERLRWLPPQRPQRYIIVNIPSQMLWALDGGRIVHEMRVVVGMPIRQTKDFTAEIRGIRFNPTWTVPPGIKLADMLPKLQDDPGALTERGIEFFERDEGGRKTIDPASVDWKSITRQDLHKISMVQRAGGNNALGQVRVLMPNDYDIYLHDTNHREFFVEDERLFSSGCIRLSEPRKIASFVLAHNDGWSDERIESTIAAGKTVEIPAKEKIPVYILYQSVWLDDHGRLVFGADVYGRDRKLFKVLKESGQVGEASNI